MDLSERRLLCHCLPDQSCHGDVLVAEFRSQFPEAYDRDDARTGPPSTEVLRFLSELREEGNEDEGSSPDGGVPDASAGLKGVGPPMEVGTGFTSRPLCDGQSLASPGRWPPERRRYPESAE